MSIIKKKSRLFRIICCLLIFLLIENNLEQVQAQGTPFLPSPQSNLLELSPSYSLPVLRGMLVYPNKPFEFDFVVDSGDGRTLDQKESSLLIKYFLTFLTVPEEDLWVNLSPYESGRIIPDEFALTDAGNALLEQDKVLKQLSSSLTYPESRLGKQFWASVYQKAYERFGTTDLPVNTYNKVWIVPDKAIVYDMGNSAVIGDTHLKVMLEEDYLALKKHSTPHLAGRTNDLHQISTSITREIILPELENEINEGKNFAPVRQIFHSLILADWFKQALRRNVLSEVYVDKKKISGIDGVDKNAKETIYKQYLHIYKVGAYNYIRVDVDPITNQTVPRKYFSGGCFLGNAAMWVKTLRVFGGYDAIKGRLDKFISGHSFGELRVKLDPIGVDQGAFSYLQDLNPVTAGDAAQLRKPGRSVLKNLILTVALLTPFAAGGFAHAATITNNGNGTLHVQVDKQTDTFSGILQQANYKKLWGPNGAVARVGDTVKVLKGHKVSKPKYLVYMNQIFEIPAPSGSKSSTTSVAPEFVPPAVPGDVRKPVESQRETFVPTTNLISVEKPFRVFNLKTVPSFFEGTLSPSASGYVQLKNANQQEYGANEEIGELQDVELEFRIKAHQQQLTDAQGLWDKLTAANAQFPRSVPGEQIEAARLELDRIKGEVSQDEQDQRNHKIILPYAIRVKKINFRDGMFYSPNVHLPLFTYFSRQMVEIDSELPNEVKGFNNAKLYVNGKETSVTPENWFPTYNSTNLQVKTIVTLDTPIKTEDEGKPLNVKLEFFLPTSNPLLKSIQGKYSRAVWTDNEIPLLPVTAPLDTDYEIQVNIGDRVHKGEVLAKANTTDLTDQYQSVKTNRENLQKQISLAVVNVDGRTIVNVAETELNNLKKQEAQAEAEEGRLKYQLIQGENIISGVDGLVVKSANVQNTRFIKTGVPLVEIRTEEVFVGNTTDTNPVMDLKPYLPVPKSFHIKEGSPVVVQAGPQVRLAATVEHVYHGIPNALTSRDMENLRGNDLVQLRVNDPYHVIVKRMPVTAIFPKDDEIKKLLASGLFAKADQATASAGGGAPPPDWLNDYAMIVDRRTMLGILGAVIGSAVSGVPLWAQQPSFNLPTDYVKPQGDLVDFVRLGTLFLHNEIAAGDVFIEYLKAHENIDLSKSKELDLTGGFFVQNGKIRYAGGLAGSLFNGLTQLGLSSGSALGVGLLPTVFQMAGDLIKHLEHEPAKKRALAIATTELAFHHWVRLRAQALHDAEVLLIRIGNAQQNVSRLNELIRFLEYANSAEANLERSGVVTTNTALKMRDTLNRYKMQRQQFQNDLLRFYSRLNPLLYHLFGRSIADFDRPVIADIRWQGNFPGVSDVEKNQWSKWATKDGTASKLKLQELNVGQDSILNPSKKDGVWQDIVRIEEDKDQPGGVKLSSDPDHVRLKPDAQQGVILKKAGFQNIEEAISHLKPLNPQLAAILEEASHKASAPQMWEALSGLRVAQTSIDLGKIDLDPSLYFGNVYLSNKPSPIYNLIPSNEQSTSTFLQGNNTLFQFSFPLLQQGNKIRMRILGLQGAEAEYVIAQSKADLNRELSEEIDTINILAGSDQEEGIIKTAEALYSSAVERLSNDLSQPNNFGLEALVSDYISVFETLQELDKRKTEYFEAEAGLRQKGVVPQGQTRVKDRAQISVKYLLLPAGILLGLSAAVPAYSQYGQPQVNPGIIGSQSYTTTIINGTGSPGTRGYERSLLAQMQGGGQALRREAVADFIKNYSDDIDTIKSTVLSSSQKDVVEELMNAMVDKNYKDLGFFINVIIKAAGQGNQYLSELGFQSLNQVFETHPEVLKNFRLDDFKPDGSSSLYPGITNQEANNVFLSFLLRYGVGSLGGERFLLSDFWNVDELKILPSFLNGKGPGTIELSKILTSLAVRQEARFIFSDAFHPDGFAHMGFTSFDWDGRAYIYNILSNQYQNGLFLNYSPNWIDIENSGYLRPQFLNMARKAVSIPPVKAPDLSEPVVLYQQTGSLNAPSGISYFENDLTHGEGEGSQGDYISKCTSVSILTDIMRFDTTWRGAAFERLKALGPQGRLSALEAYVQTRDGKDDGLLQTIELDQSWQNWFKANIPTIIQGPAEMRVVRDALKKMSSHGLGWALDLWGSILFNSELYELSKVNDPALQPLLESEMNLSGIRLAIAIREFRGRFILFKYAGRSLLSEQENSQLNSLREEIGGYVPSLTQEEPPLDGIKLPAMPGETDPLKAEEFVKRNAPGEVLSMGLLIADEHIKKNDQSIPPFPSAFFILVSVVSLYVGFAYRKDLMRKLQLREHKQDTLWNIVDLARINSLEHFTDISVHGAVTTQELYKKLVETRNGDGIKIFRIPAPHTRHTDGKVLEDMTRWWEIINRWNEEKGISNDQMIDNMQEIEELSLKITKNLPYKPDQMIQPSGVIQQSLFYFLMITNYTLYLLGSRKFSSAQKQRLEKMIDKIVKCYERNTYYSEAITSRANIQRVFSRQLPAHHPLEQKTSLGFSRYSIARWPLAFEYLREKSIFRLFDDILPHLADLEVQLGNLENGQQGELIRKSRIALDEALTRAGTYNINRTRQAEIVDREGNYKREVKYIFLLAFAGLSGVAHYYKLPMLETVSVEISVLSILSLLWSIWYYSRPNFIFLDRSGYERGIELVEGIQQKLLPTDAAQISPEGGIDLNFKPTFIQRHSQADFTSTQQATFPNIPDGFKGFNFNIVRFTSNLTVNGAFQLMLMTS